MRISDWSPDVCSSDLEHLIEAGLTRFACFSLPEAQTNRWARERESAYCRLLQRDGLPVNIYRGLETSAPLWEIGRASCRERVCQYVSISVVAVSLKKKKK